jgi:glucose/arabinose dehydrogenase
MKKLYYILGFIVAALIALLCYFFVTYKSFNLPFTSALPENSNGTTLLPFVLPQEFAMSIFAEGVTGARVIAHAPKGIMLVSEPKEGKVVALPDEDHDGLADRIVTVIENLDYPHGLAFRCTDPEQPDLCTLYIAETGAVSAFDYDPAAMKATNRVKLVDLPTDGLTPHVTRTLLFMPVPNENTLLISVGSSCNVCHEEDSRRARVLAYDVVTKKTEEFARGLRNTVFMDIHLVTGAIWGTEMGRDGLGDDIPPDEINIIEKEKNYGWPICFGNNIHDDEFDKNTYFRNPCMAPHETPSHIDIQAHSAPLGLAFIPEEGWPEDHWYNLLVAYHGSWNREELTGYKIVRFPLDAAGKPHGEPVDFITGWLRPDGTRIGRPVDIKVFSGGTMYISDDQAGIIYRVVRTEAS